MTRRWTSFKQRNPVGLVFSGGPSSVYEPGAPQIDRAVYDLGLPILGICYGMQAMAHDLGGKVSAATLKEFGKTRLDVLDPTVLFEGLNPELVCWMSHGDTVEEPRPASPSPPPPRTARSPPCTMPTRRFYAVQFHPEVVHTPWGTEVIRGFVEKVCGTAAACGRWESFIEQQVATDSASRSATNQVVCGLSGGID